MSCHGGGTAVLDAPPGTRIVTIALAGNPNVGKSTLFNLLTGARQSVVNAPGTTVELQTGTWRTLSRALDARVTLLDLPGTYSLVAHSPDERIAADVIAGDSPLGTPDVVLVLLDATALARSLTLLRQILDSGTRVVAAVCMRDVAAGRGVEPDLAALALASGVRTVGIDPRSGTGLPELTTVVEEVLEGDACPCCASGSCRTGCSCCAMSVAPAPSGGTGEREDDTGVGHAVVNLADSAIEPTGEADIARFEWVSQVLTAAHPEHVEHRAVRTISDRVDRVLLHPITGIPVFLAVMWAVFQLTTAVAAPLIDGVGGLFDGPIADWFRSWLPGPA